MTRAYGTIVIDPPWAYTGKWAGTSGWRSRRHGFQGAATNYPTMELWELEALKVRRWAAPGAHLYVWATNAFLAEAMALIRAWGFDQKTVLTWVKGRVDSDAIVPAGNRLVQQIGPGHYFRNSTEHALFAVAPGPTRRLHSRNVPTALVAPRRGHSEKPEAFYDLVEAESPGPWLEIFARRRRLGWDVLGDEVTGERL